MKNVNREGGPQEKETGLPFGSFQKMDEMMKDCCKGNETPFDCRTMMNRMMRTGRGGAKTGGQDPRTAPDQGQDR